MSTERPKVNEKSKVSNGGSENSSNKTSSKTTKDSTGIIVNLPDTPKLKRNTLISVPTVNILIVF